MITIDASGASSGMDFEAFVRGGFISDVEGGGFPVFDNSGAFSGEEMFISYGEEATSKYVLAHGSLEYYFSTHTVWGTINTIEYGARGTGSFDDEGYFSGGEVELRITGLDLSNPQPTNSAEETEIEANGAVHNFAVGYMYGQFADLARLAKFADALDTEAQHFIGSAFDDVFTGTVFADIIEGGDGADRLSGNGGDDVIDGGDGIDTAVFAGDLADHNLTRYADGRVVVTPTSTVAATSGKTTLRNVESIEFDDQTISVDDLAVTEPRGRITIDASNASGVDFPAYLASYLTKVETEATYEFHSGVEDHAYGQTFYLNGSQLSFKYRESGDTEGAFVYVVVLDGEEIAYDFIHHGPSYGHDISGAVDSISFGMITGTEPESGPDAFTDYLAEVVISGLGLDDAPDAEAGLVNALYYYFLEGDADGLSAFLAEYAQDFIGSTRGDGFDGTEFDDTAKGGKGNDDLGGGGGNDKLKGNSGHDRLDGSDGEDILVGGKGRDKLAGGAGPDIFVFKSPNHSAWKPSKSDKLLDFSQADGDLIDLSGFGGLAFIGTDKFSGDGDEVRVVEKAAKTIVKVTTDGDTRPEFSLKLAGAHSLTEDDFLL